MGTDRRKTHLLLGGKPILEHTVGVFERSSLIDSIIVVVAPDEVPEWEQHLKRREYAKVNAIVAGGETRQQSVYRGLRQAADADLVVVHDGVRPLVSPRLIEACVEAAYHRGAAIAAVPVKDTIKVADLDGKVRDTLDRRQLWAVQTPQVFRRDWLQAAHDQALADGTEATDDAALVERLGYPVYLVQGDYRNLKITTPEDLTIAEAFLKLMASIPADDGVLP